MATTIRLGVFETNSSSVHSIMILSPQDYEAWAAGNLVYDYWNGGFVTAEEAKELELTKPDYMDGDSLLSLDDFVNCQKQLNYLESEVYRTTTPGGEEIYLATYYGRK